MNCFFSKSENLIFTEDEVIGKLITHADFLIQIEAIEGVRIEADESLIAGFPCFNKYYFAITDNLDSSIKDYDFIYRFFNTRKNFIKSARIIRLNNSDFLEHAENLLRDFKFPISFTFRYSGYEFQNDKNGKISGFKEMEGLECTSFPIGSNPPQLAAMKLDMDNLESIFEIGLGYKAPISKIATLSRLMDNFFSVYIKSLSKEFDIYIAYSGGDDVLVIGDWYKIIHFARALYTKFNEFSCNNPNLTFSAGVFICNENYLLSKVADKADEQLKLSKNYINQEGKKKNAITIFDHTLTWDRFSKMLDFAEKLLLYTNVEGAKNKEKLASSLVQRLFNIIKSSLDNQGCVNTDKLYRKVAELHYLFARHGFTSANIVEARDGIARDIISLILCDFSKKEIIKDYLIPVNYVILKNRSVNKKIP